MELPVVPVWPGWHRPLHRRRAQVNDVDRLLLLNSYQDKPTLSCIQLQWIRQLAFVHECRDIEAPKMIADLIPIYTVKAIAEKLTT